MPLVKSVAGNLHGISLVGFDLTKGIVIEVFDELWIDCTDEEAGISQPAGYRFVIAAGVFQDDPGISLKGSNLSNKIIDLVRCVSNLIPILAVHIVYLQI